PTGADATASAVERMRTLTDEQIADTAPVQVKADVNPLVRSIESRLQEVLTQQPELVVAHEADGRPITAAEEVARLHQEAMNGTEAELGTLDADLVRVAADCALSMGAA